MGAVQKKLVSLGIGTVVMGGLAAYAYFGTFKGKKAEEEKKQAEEKVASFTAADVKEVTITAKGITFVAVGDGQGERKWRLTQPLETAADKTTLDGLVTHFVDMKSKRRVDYKPEDLATFGLAPPMATVGFKTADGKASTYLVGKKNAFDDNVYLLRDGDTQVAMVPPGIVYQSDRDLFSLREKRPLVFEDKDVQKVEVELKGQPAYTLERRGDEWQLTKPLDVKADKAQVTTLISQLRYARAKAVPEEALPADDKYLLAKPEAAVTLTLGEARTRVVFSRVTQKGGGEQFYAHVDGQKPVLEMSDDMAKKLEQKPAELRDKTVLAFNRDDIKKMKLAETGKDFVVFEKKDQWEIVAPEQKPAQESKITNLLYKLSTLKAKEILSDTVTDEVKKKYGLEPVSKQITLYKGDGSEAGTLLIGTSPGDVSAVYAAQGSRIDGVDKAQLADVSFDVLDYLKAETASSAK